ncbi:MAG: hypothetical protein C4297_13830 [Gemmataceae bacterium]
MTRVLSMVGWLCSSLGLAMLLSAPLLAPGVWGWAEMVGIGLDQPQCPGNQCSTGCVEDKNCYNRHDCDDSVEGCKCNANLPGCDKCKCALTQNIRFCYCKTKGT